MYRFVYREGMCKEIPLGVGCTSSARYRSYRRFISLEGVTGGWLTRSFQLVRDITDRRLVFDQLSMPYRSEDETMPFRGIVG